MKPLRIVTDSTSHIPPSLRNELGIHVVPLPFVWDGKTYLDDEVEPREFYSRLRKTDAIPTTSGPTPGSFKKEFDALAADGSPVLAIVIGKELSSTYNSANLAKDMCAGSDITVFNTDTTSMALGFMVIAAARAARAGRDLTEILAMLTRLRSSCGVFFAVRNLQYMVHGGRISHLQWLIASVLNLVPIMELSGGAIRLIERVRSERHVPDRLMALVEQRCDGNRPLRLAVMHADAESKAWQLERDARARLAPAELMTAEVLPVQGIHTGPDALGLAYCSGA